MSYPTVQLAPASGIVDRALSTGFIAALPQDEQDRVRALVMRIIEGERLFLDHARIAFPYATALHLFRKRGLGAKRGQRHHGGALALSSTVPSR